MKESMVSADNKVCRLEEYSPSAWMIPMAELMFELDPQETLVTSRLHAHRLESGTCPLWLDSRELDVVDILIDGVAVEAENLSAHADGVELRGLPDQCLIQITTRIRPTANKSLMGLYVSGGVLITQCEPEGFRRLTCFPDRPDILTRYRVTLVDKSGMLPVMLSNGNPVAEGYTAEGQRWVCWEDPHPKSSYLFALVAGDLQSHRMTVCQGATEIALSLFAPADMMERGALALEVLADAIAWDSRRYSREYDLTCLNLVVVRDFEGAMENKGLLVASPHLALFDPQHATDWDRMVIENTLSHEYFHNWTGNRVTCRDWFQIGLKEGLTTFRHWQFSEERAAADMKRLWQVRLYMDLVFGEEAGANVHAVRPSEYCEISNFFTATVYKKGAEIARMLHVVLGDERFRAGMDCFFADFDGQAATWEDWLAAMTRGSGTDVSLFSAWYSTAGTPTARIGTRYDADRRVLTLNVSQVMAKKGKDGGAILPLPMAFGLLNRDGEPLVFRLAHETKAAAITRVVVVTLAEFRIELLDVAEDPVPSVFRGFSAPVHVEDGLDSEDLVLLALHDPDPVSRWRCFSKLIENAVRLIANGADASQNGDTADSSHVARLFSGLLMDSRLDDLTRYELLQLPEIGHLRDPLATTDVLAIDAALRQVRAVIAWQCKSLLVQAWQERPLVPYAADAKAMGRRRVRNLCLAYLTEHFPDEFAGKALQQLADADNMSDIQAALEALCHISHPAHDEALAWFEQRWTGDGEAMDKWFQAQARSRRSDVLARVGKLADHPAFDPENPARVRALLRTLAMENPAALHGADGAGYRFLVDQQLRLDGLGEKTAAWSHLLDEFGRMAHVPTDRRILMRRELDRLMATPGLSVSTREKAMRCRQVAEAER